MAKRKRRKSAGVSRWVILGVLLVGAAATAAFYASDRFKLGLSLPTQKPTVTVTQRAVPVVAERTVYIYLPKDSSKGVYLSRVAIACREKGSLPDVALKALFAAGQQGGGAAGLIPEGAKPLSPVRIQGDVATVDLNGRFKHNFSGGLDQEALTVNSIVHTVVSNSGGKVSKLRILVEGETVETLGGHLELTDPIAADSALLRPGSME